MSRTSHKTKTDKKIDGIYVSQTKIRAKMSTTILSTKAKVLSQKAVRTQGRSRGMALHILNPGTGWRWVINITSRSRYPRDESQYPLSRRLSGPKGRSSRRSNVASGVQTANGLMWVCNVKN
jgi:hypothetical protein